MMETNQLIIEKVSPWDFDKTVLLLTEEAERRNWMIPATHDLQASLAKSGKAVRPVKVLEICKPEYSGQMLERNDERIVSVIMPCRISIYLKEDDKTYVAFLDGAGLAAGLPENAREVIYAASEEVKEIIESVF
jgi:uncharacterized protein (DUF302 family)